MFQLKAGLEQYSIKHLKKVNIKC